MGVKNMVELICSKAFVKILGNDELTLDSSLAHFRPMLQSKPLENVRKPKDFWHFQGV